MSAARLPLLYKQLFSLLVALQLVSFFSATPVVLAAEAKDQPQLLVQERFAQEEFLQLANQARQQAGLPALTLNTQLQQAAEAKAVDMEVEGYFDHFRPSDGATPWSFIERAGYDYRFAGENLAEGFATPTGITKAWLASPAHAANILSPHFTNVGFACIQTGHGLLTVEMFGSR